jgi:hypothetical protein
MLSEAMKIKYNEYLKDVVTNHNEYKMKKENYELWLSYLRSHPAKETYQDFVNYKEKNK